jgi:c-di-AMP phosphodiesterase-like protein
VPQETVNILKPDENESKIILKIKNNVEEIKPGFVLSVYDGELDAHVIASAANELLRTAGRKAAFVIAKTPGKNQCSLSARSINVNVQIITELVGGGGHFSAAAATTNETLEVFKDNLVQAIVSVKTNENNNN